MGYVKKNFLAGKEFIDFSAVQPAAQLWVDTVADVRVQAGIAPSKVAPRPRVAACGQQDLHGLTALHLARQKRGAKDANAL